jgi:hypothetical protein
MGDVRALTFTPHANARIVHEQSALHQRMRVDMLIQAGWVLHVARCE